MNLRKFAAALKKHRLLPPLFWLCGGLCLLAFFRRIRTHTAAMEWWLVHVSMPYKRFMGGLVDKIPVSMAEVVCAVAVVAVLAFLFDTVRRLVKKRPVALAARLLGLAAAGLWVYLGVTAFWGTQYYGVSYQQKTGVYALPMSREQLRATTIFFRDRMNATSGLVPRDENGEFALTVEEVFAESDGLYDYLAEFCPCLDGPDRTPKPAFFSRAMSWCGFTGYIFPLLGETTLNVDCPPVLLPATVAHEQSHQRGVAPEQEANFWAVLACTTSGKPAYIYSGWMFGFIHLFNALYKVEPEAALDIMRGLNLEAAADMGRNSEYWKQYEGPVEKVAGKNYSAFIGGYGQTLGMESYGACVDLLVTFYSPMAMANG